MISIRAGLSPVSFLAGLDESYGGAVGGKEVRNSHNVSRERNGTRDV
jgi:hypothetical protein